MKKFVFSLILMLFAFCALPVQASAPYDGVKTEIVKAYAFDFEKMLEVYPKVPQVLFDNYRFYRTSELWNYNIKKTVSYLNVLNSQKRKSKNWRFIDKNKANLTYSFIIKENRHIDTGRFFVFSL
jgi:hypothetical protein